jgi:Cof subfamily protein (haloacid dehalogenase superfamily)
MRRAAVHPSIKVVGQADPDTITRLRPHAVTAFGRDLYVTQTAANLLEFLHPDVSKGSALRHVAALLDVAREEIIAFGDSHNDLTMFAYAGLAVAMRNATPEVRAGADLVTESNEEDGVAAALEQLGLVEG